MLQEEDSHFQSENTLLQQQYPQSYNDYVVDYIEDSNSGKYQSHSISVYSFSEIACIEESGFELMNEEGSFCVCKTHILP